jgi:hypothetical protein
MLSGVALVARFQPAAPDRAVRAMTRIVRRALHLIQKAYKISHLSSVKVVYGSFVLDAAVELINSRFESPRGLGDLTRQAAELTGNARRAGGSFTEPRGGTSLGGVQHNLGSSVICHLVLE